jgi:outer membrane protein assembly factor BamB
MIRKLTLIAGLIVGVSTVALHAGDWPQFRGPQSDGVAATAVPSEWGPDSNVQWKVKIPGLGWSSPIVCGDKVFVTTASTENQTKPQAMRGMRGGPGGGFGGGGGRGRGGRGGPGGFGPPEPGQIMPPFLRDRLSLTDEQKKQVDELQKEVDTQLAKLLTDEQKKTLKEPDEDGPRFRRPQPGQILPSAEVARLKLSDAQKKQLDELQKTTRGKLDKVLNAEQKDQLQAMREGGGRRGGGPGGPGGMGPGGMGRGGRGRGGMGGGRAPDKVYHWQVVCLDRQTGKMLWTKQALEGKPKIPIQQSNTYATETPVSDGHRVYAYFGMHGLYCYDFDGKELWKKDFGSYPTVMGQGPASSPVLDGERLYLQIDNEEKSFLVALNAETGSELWRVPRDERTNHSSPVVWKNKLRTELVTSGSHKVRSYDPATGKVLWELGMGGGRCYSSPAADADMLYVGSEPGMGSGGGGGLFAVRAGAAGDITLKENETTNAGIAWSSPRGGPEKASPLIYQGHLYVLRTNGGIVTCYDKTTGKQLYRQRIPGAAAFWTSPWAADGKIFCLDDAGTTHVLDAGPEFKLLGTNKLNELFWASAAVSDGSIYLRGVDNLYCIRGNDAKK